MGFIFDPLVYAGLIPTSPAGSGVPIYANIGSFPLGAAQGSLGVARDTGIVYEWNGSAWVPIGGPGVMTSVGSIDTGTPSPNGAQDLNNQLILQSASTSNPGLVNNSAQSFNGVKTFTNDVNLSYTSVSTPVKTDSSKNLITAAIALATSDVTGVLPVANGGTNSSTNLNNNRIMVSSGGAIVEEASISPNQALISNANGLPTSSVTTATELSYVNGVTSSIQTQLNGKASTSLNNLASTAVNVPINMNSHQINNVSDPSSAQDAMTLNYATNTYIPLSQKAAPLGVATLDASGKIPSSELPSVVLQYQGLWNPATNTPTLSDASGTAGYVYQVSTYAAGPISGLNNSTMVNFQVGNLVIYSSAISQWEQADAVTGVVSVNGAQGVVTVNAINQLTGAITAGPASGSQSVVATISTGAVTATKLGTVTDGITLDQSGSGSTLEIKTGGVGSSQLAANSVTTAKLGTITDGITLDQSGSGSTLEIKAGGISNTQISATAAIARTKLATGTAYAWETNNSSGVLQDTSVTANSAVATDANGLPVASSTTATELSYVHGVTSAIQTQINGLANTSLSNLSSTALNIALNLNSHQINNVSDPSNAQDAVTLNYLQNHTTASVPGDIGQTSFTIANNQSSTSNVTGLTFANASVRSAEIQYSITISATTSLYEEGKIKIIQNGSGWNLSQQANFDNTNVIFSITSAGQVQYTSPNYTGYSLGKMQFRAIVTGV